MWRSFEADSFIVSDSLTGRVVVFMPNNETQFTLFKDYMNYFS